MENQASSPVLRVCIPDDTHPEGAKCYNICFKDEAQFKQAMTALYSTGRLSLSSKGSLPAFSDTSSLSETSTGASSLSSTDDGQVKIVSTEASEEAQIIANREDALAFLEGTKKPIRMRDWENSDNAVYFDVFAWWDELEEEDRQKRENPDLVVKKSETGPIFSWSALYRVLQSQLPEKDLDLFPDEAEELEPTLLYLKESGHGASEEVYCRAPLAGKSVSFFEALMFDVEVRGWNDVLWLGRPGEELPSEVKQRGVRLLWGESMI